MVNQKSCAYTLEEKVEVYNNQKGSYVLLYCIVLYGTYRDPGLVSRVTKLDYVTGTIIVYILQQE